MTIACQKVVIGVLELLSPIYSSVFNAESAAYYYSISVLLNFFFRQHPNLDPYEWIVYTYYMYYNNNKLLYYIYIMLYTLYFK